MLFNSIEFAVFLPIVFLLYWFAVYKNLRNQNLLLLLASYIFYGWWDYRFLSLIVFSSFVDYTVGKRLGKTTEASKRKWLLWISIVVNIGFLGFFKYYNFFIDSFVEGFSFFGKSFSADRLEIILPVGISFYTFQTLSYTIDVYNKKLEPTRDAISFFAFVSFFPQLVAGPIERATNLLPQFYVKRKFDLKEAIDGMRQILWGLFKKIVIADNAAVFVNMIFSDYDTFSGSTLLMGSFFFAFQIYGDFSGYSDIAIGTSRLFGFKLMQNFAFPYFSRDIAEFWRRWHISLSTWFRDYLYIPLGGSKGGKYKSIRNIFIIFIVSGFWHGANWTFIIWGLVNALLFLPLMLFDLNRMNLRSVAQGKIFVGFKDLFKILVTFTLVLFAWIFFRSPTVLDAVLYVKGIFSSSLLTIPEVLNQSAIRLLAFIGLLIMVEWLQREQNHGLENLDRKIPRLFRWLFYYAVVAIIVIYGGNQQDFIYFQF